MSWTLATCRCRLALLVLLNCHGGEAYELHGCWFVRHLYLFKASIVYWGLLLLAWGLSGLSVADHNPGANVTEQCITGHTHTVTHTHVPRSASRLAMMQDFYGSTSSKKYLKTHKTLQPFQGNIMQHISPISHKYLKYQNNISDIEKNISNISKNISNI